MKKTIYRLSVVAAALAAVLLTAQCAKEIDPAAESKSQDGIGDGIEVTLTATKGEGTRTELTASGAEMTVTWSTGDKIYVVGENDGLRGSLTLSSGAGSTSATFKGCISYLTAQQNVRFYYLGKSGATISDNTFALNISSQDGTLDGIESTMHLMCGTLSNVSPSTISFGSVTMTNMISIVKVDTRTAFGEVSDITLGGTVSSASVNLKTGAVTPSSDDITLTGTASTEYYIALLSNSASQSLTFSKNGKIYNLTPKTVADGRYYTDGGSPIALSPYVDLGLSVCWASSNVGATESNAIGHLFAWGEIAKREGTINSTIEESAYKFYGGSTGTMSKYNCKTSNVSTTNLHRRFFLELADDAANQNFSSDAHIPTKEQWQELIDNTTCVVSGSKPYTATFTSTVSGYTDRSITLPLADSNNDWKYWTSTLDQDDFLNALIVSYSDGTSKFSVTEAKTRTTLFPVRPVKDKYPYYNASGEYWGAGIKVGSTVWAPVNCGTDVKHPYGLMYQWGRKLGQGWNFTALSPDETDPTYVGYDEAPYNGWCGENGNEDPNTCYIFTSGKCTITPDNTNDWIKTGNDNYWNGSGNRANPVKTQYDPCPAGWRTCTIKEYESLFGQSFEAASVTRVACTKDAMNGLYLNGTAANDITKGVFLPAAAYVNLYHAKQYESKDRRGNYAGYWSSTPMRELKPSSEDAHGAVGGYFTYTNSQFSSSVQYMGSRAYAMSVRCVYDGEVADTGSATLGGMSNSEQTTW